MASAEHKAYDRTKSERLRSARAIQCRICLAEDERENLISPCSCRGTQANVHDACLNRLFQVMNTKTCQVCKEDYTMERRELKSCSEWSWPQPLSDTWEDELDFKCAILWMFFMSRILYTIVVRGTQETFQGVTEVIGDGKVYYFWLTSFILNMAYYSAILYAVGKKWMVANSVYSWRDRKGGDARLSDAINQ